MPTKVTYRRFEEDSSIEFDFFLTEKLHLGTVSRMRREMSCQEYLEWSIYYGRKAQLREIELAKVGS